MVLIGISVYFNNLKFSKYFDYKLKFLAV